MAGLKIAKGSYLKPSDLASVTWLGLFLPGLVCYVYFLSQHLNQYDEVPNSFVERFSSRLDEVVPPGAKVEMVANGFGHTEGPQWVNDEEAGRQYLLFSDIPNNRIWKWEEGGGIFTLGKSLFLDRSGCRGDHCAGIPRLGSNGLVIAPGTGEVVMCEHGDRRVARMENNGTKTALATHYNGRRLNSPNDLVFSRRGDLYFTDPPYGLPLGPEDPAFAANGFGGVYRIRRETINAAKSGQLVAAEPELLERDLMFPNGLAFSADFSKLYLSVSSPEEPAWYVYDLDDEGRLTNRRRLLDAKPMQKGGRTGCPDGVKVDAEGVIFAASPGGVAVINSDGDHLGTVFTGGVVAANVALGGDGYLYIAAADSIMRIRVMTKASPTPIPP